MDVTGGPVFSLGGGYEGLLNNRRYWGVGARQMWFAVAPLKGSATEGFVTLGLRVD